MFRKVWTPVVPDLTSFWPVGKPIWGKWANDYDVAQLQVWTMEAYWCHAVQKIGIRSSGRLTTAPEDLQLFQRTYNCYGRLISVPEDLLTVLEHLLTALQHLLTAPEHFCNCSTLLNSGTLSNCSVALANCPRTLTTAPEDRLLITATEDL